MTDRPILFSSAMVLALLAGRKTQTRRILKPQPIYPDLSGCTWRFAFGYKTTKADPPWMEAGRPTSYYGATEIVAVGRVPCRVGDRLWVREVVACGTCAPSRPASWAPSFWRREQGSPNNRNGLWYRADGLAPEKPITDRGRWVPSIHMPRWASRLTLHVTDVRVEKLDDISEEDARAEGVECDSDGWKDYQMPSTQCCASAHDSFRTLWDSINGDGAWEANPWICAISFETIHANIDAKPAIEVREIRRG